MKITTTMLKKLDRILEGDLPSSRQGIATLASKLKDQIVVLIKAELDQRERG